MKKVLLAFLGIFCTMSLYGQQDAQFSQYMFNTLYYNPGYAGVEGLTTFKAFHRTQWAGYEPSFTSDGAGGLNTQVVSLNTPLLRLRSGLGLHVVNDKLGPLTNLEAQVSFAYHLGIGDSKLSLGVRAGVFSQSIDFDQYRWVQQDDPLRQEGKPSQIRPDLSIGVFYRARQYYAGISVKHLMKSEFDFGADSLRNPLENHMIITGGFDYEPTYKLTLTPSFLVQSDLNTFSFDVSVLATYDNTMWGGVSYRQSEAMVIMLGYSFLKEKSLKLGYSFDYIVKAQDAKQPTSHEIMVSYSLPVTSNSEKKIIRTPRFRQ